MALLGQLSLLWACVAAASCMLHMTGPQPRPVAPGPPPAPKLSLSPPHGIFVQGEGVRLTCSAPERRRPEEFQFYKLKPDGKWILQIRKKGHTWKVLSPAHLETQSTFVCTYSEGNSTRELLQSGQSNPCVVSLVELPPAALSLDPEFPVYLRGEKVTLACSAPEGQQVSGYIFYKQQRNQTLRELPNSGRGPYEEFKVNRSTAGKYSCAYWMLHSGQEVRSPLSSLISVAMTEQPPPPIFSVSPKQEVYRSGQLINLTCSTPDRPHVSRVTFLKESQHLLATRFLSSPHSFTHTLRLQPQDGGRYSCRYQAVGSGREIPSPTSNIIGISVMALTVPGPSAAVWPAHTYGTTTRVPGTGVPTSPALPLTSSQLVIEEHPHPAEPDGPAASVPSSSQPTSHDGISSGTDSQGSTKPLDAWGSTELWDPRGATKPFDSQSSSKTFTGRSDPRSTSHTRTVPVEENREDTEPLDETLRLPLVAGCTAAGILSLVFLAWLLRKKMKGDSKTQSRSFWEILDDQHFRRISRSSGVEKTEAQEPESAITAETIQLSQKERRRGHSATTVATKHTPAAEMAVQMAGRGQQLSSGTNPRVGPQERVSQVLNEDWGILPKSKPVASRHGGTAKESKADDDDDSGAEFKFPEIDLTYTLVHYPCSTFFEAECHSPAEDTHIYQEALC